jgi:hypothetical protein
VSSKTYHTGSRSFRPQSNLLQFQRLPEQHACYLGRSFWSCEVRRTFAHTHLPGDDSHHGIDLANFQSCSVLHFIFWLPSRTKYAVVVGEFGGRNVGADQEWQSEFMKYLLAKRFSFFYWCLNPGSQDTGGLLAEDWRTVDDSKVALLQQARATAVAPLRWHFQRKHS